MPVHSHGCEKLRWEPGPRAGSVSEVSIPCYQPDRVTCLLILRWDVMERLCLNASWRANRSKPTVTQQDWSSAYHDKPLLFRIVPQIPLPMSKVTQKKKNNNLEMTSEPFCLLLISENSGSGGLRGQLPVCETHWSITLMWSSAEDIPWW